MRVLAPNPGPFTLEGTNTWVVGRDPAAVIDPGPDDPSHLLEVLDAAGEVAVILLTHHHPDHAPGARRLAEASGAPVRAFRPQEGEERISHGDRVGVGGAHLRAVHTPGHTPDHLAFFMEEERALFTGDAVLGRGTSVVDPPEGDMIAYLRSLETMRSLEARLIYPGHGPVVFDADRKLREYLDHRAMRERQVLRALEAGKHTAQEMVPDIYGDEIPDDLHPAAARSVLAQLLKLEHEGRVQRVGMASEGRFVPATPHACERCGRPAPRGSRFCRRCGLSVLQEGPD